jgi:hypothetical protein
MKKKEPNHFVVCLDNEGYQASLEVGKLYRYVPDKEAQAEGLLRVIDESGEDYLYPVDWFVFIDLPRSLERSLLRAA